MKSYFIWVAVAVFLLFVVTSVYLNFRPTHWHAVCFKKDPAPGWVVRSEKTTARLAKEFAATYEKLGLTCAVSRQR